MPVYGIIQEGQLVVVGQNYPGALPVVYEDVPLFDQTTHYATQQAPVDVGNHIFMGVELRELDTSETEDGEPSD